ncbi:MAG: hypothetical protein FI687_00540 [SAR202 cluster bacterium]|nr:hypothetical protein [SAR202 cluster bacterium]|tara:strand:- start:7466 stop:7726 length:261 start_codon:yes stop_codon:yes gene_type:complete
MSQSNNQEPKHKYFDFKSQDLKTQMQNLEDCISIASKEKIEIWIDSDQETFLAMAPLKAINAKLKCSIKEIEKQIWRIILSDYKKN